MNRNQCSWPGCDRPRGKTYLMCTMHYQRKFNGTPMDAPVKTVNGTLMAFLHASMSMDTDECIIWPYGRDKDGYAKAEAATEIYGTSRVYRVVCMIKHGPPASPELQAAHTCGKGALGCINHRHVEWKTPKENNLDKVRHGTAHIGGFKRKITADQVLLIRDMWAAGKPQKVIGKEFGVSQTCIQAITSGRTWKHI